MPENNTAYIHVFCRDCGHRMAVIQQEGLDASCWIQVTCWQPHCLLWGFTLSLDRYLSLNQSQLEAYRQMNPINRPPYVRLKTIETLPSSDLYTSLLRLINTLESMDKTVTKGRVRIVHKISEAAAMVKLICSLNREIRQCNKDINKFLYNSSSTSNVVSLEFQSRTLQQRAFLLREQYRVLVGEIEEIYQKQLEYMDKTVAPHQQMACTS